MTRFPHFSLTPAAAARFCARHWLTALLGAAALLGVALSFALSVPPDHEQGDAVKIMFVHVPAAWASMGIFALLASLWLGFLLTRAPLLDMAAAAMLAPGALFTFLALATGALWGKPIWGAWWVWDARLTSVLILFMTYLGLIGLRQALDAPSRRAQASAIMALVGAVNLPIVKFSVDWWQSLHQPASLIRSDGIHLDSVYLVPLLLMALAYFAFFAAFWLINFENEMLAQKAERWRDSV